MKKSLFTEEETGRNADVVLWEMQKAGTMQTSPVI